MIKKGGARQPMLATNIHLKGTSLVEKVVFAKHLSLMVKSGVVISEALKILYQGAQGKFKTTIGEIYNSVKSGRTLSRSLARYPKIFSDFFVGAVYAGESSGTLGESLENVANELRKEKELDDKIKGALLYPIIILVAAFALSLFLAFYILPKIIPLFEGLKMKLPWTTRALIAGSHFIQKNGSWLLISIIIAVVVLLWLLRQNFAKPFFHKIWLSLPIVNNIIRQANLARFTRTLGTLLGSGLNIVEALEITAKTTTNYYYARALAAVGKGVSKGNKLSLSLEKYQDYFPDMLIRMLAIGEESGKLEETLAYLADFYELEVDNATKNLSTVVEPILLIVIGLGVGFLALSIITPIYGITGAVQ
jgi:type IV pilus assembly protein PilC